MELKLGPLTRAQGKKLKILDANVANGLVAYMEKALKKKLEGFEDQGKASKLLSICTINKIIEGSKWKAKMSKDDEEFKKGKSSATIEQRVGDKLGGFNSTHHQRPFDNVSTYGYHDMRVQNSYPFHEGGYQDRQQVRGGRRGRLEGRGYYRLKEKFPRHEA
ncbi:hypothetical protein M9H77_29782 [Catharanthus roseus]|uniref:Uncharacterized protein n=1 Tax=Catharanthus roseus TaxID=4058 RepID=A0ACB9ZXA2_CATRO|nr:hypothetical protein M9H77_29782 [Catharanthus roseus]